MVWDFVEINPFSSSVGNFLNHVDWVAHGLEGVPAAGTQPCIVDQADAEADMEADQLVVISTDPPYYDNVPYADLSDFFYIWMRRGLRDVFPSNLATLLVPKQKELVADPFRHGGARKAHEFFMHGMEQVLGHFTRVSTGTIPCCIYYAFKQSENSEGGASRTGWEAFLTAMLKAGFLIDGTWPIRTERTGRIRDFRSNALASSIVLVCRKRPSGAPDITRGDFRRLLKQDLPEALRSLQKGNVAPVDMAQASIGPGMAIFSRHAKVLEADGSSMSVRSALQLIQQITDEVRGEEEGEFDADTRFAVTWFESHCFEEGPYGEAETLATARAVSVSGVQEAGVLKSGAGSRSA